MIKLHPGLTDDLIEFATFEEIASRSAYSADVNPASVQLTQPIGVYRFRDKVACGLKNCHTPHNRGLVVLVSDGSEVNIGHICGRKHFGDTYRQIANIAHRAQTRKVHRAVIQEIRAVSARTLTKITELMDGPRGAVWCFRAKRRMERALPDDAINSIKDLARRGDAVVYEYTRVSGDEADLRRELGIRSSGGRAYGAETVAHTRRGALQGLEIWNRDPARELYEVKEGLEALIKLDTIECPRKLLKEMADFASQVNSRVALAEALIQQGQRFFTPDNFGLLQYLPRISDSTSRVLRQLKWDFDAATPIESRVA